MLLHPPSHYDQKELELPNMDLKIPPSLQVLTALVWPLVEMESTTMLKSESKFKLPQVPGRLVWVHL